MWSLFEPHAWLIRAEARERFLLVAFCKVVRFQSWGSHLNSWSQSESLWTPLTNFQERDRKQEREKKKRQERSCVCICVCVYFLELIIVFKECISVTFLSVQAIHIEIICISIICFYLCNHRAPSCFTLNDSDGDTVVLSEMMHVFG